MPGGVCTELHLLGEDTDGAFCLMVDHPPAGWELPAHRHLGEAETIHVIEGEFEMQIDGRSLLLHAGETVHVPAGVVHSGRNPGACDGRRLVTFSPAGIERFFLETGVAGPDVEIDLREALASARRHGWEFEA
jgi:quercetin dioxygenase-like cupin family protein